MFKNKLTLSVKELANQLSISKPKAYELVNTKGFPVVKIGNRIIIPTRQLETWLEENTKNQIDFREQV